ncbi:MAG: DUF1460 domain-containing protein [Deltaproteobacteria bacterium]|nr:DUF1460 domain-containing protein [Deltaproteobacteria bacterium]
MASLLLASSRAAAGPLATEEVGRLLPEIHRRHAGFDARLETVSALFLGAPHRLSPLGEGPGSVPDPDPLFDFTRFDCLTYVEEVMALGWYGDLATATRELQRIRYTGGQVRYGARKHIMMAQWIPQNVAAGFVRDITREVGESATVVARLQVRSEQFERGPGTKLLLAAADRPVGSYELPIVPIALAAGLADRVPHGTIVTSIRRADPRLPYRAGHVGLVLVLGGERRVRHATAARGRVVEQSFASFVAWQRRKRQRPVEGLNLLAIAKAPPRR